MRSTGSKGLAGKAKAKDSEGEEGKADDKKKTRRSEKPLSAALLEASHHVKDFMTENQKALAYLKAGKLQSDRGVYRGALECYTEGISCNPSASLFNARAQAYKHLNMWKEAYFDYCYAIRMEPESGSFYCSRGIVLAKMKRFKPAIEDCSTACELQSTPFHHFIKGTIHAEAEQYDDSLEELRNCLNFEACPTDLKLKAIYRKALCYFEQKNFSKCTDDLTFLLNFDPNSVPPRALLARALKMQNDLTKANEQISLCITSEKDNYTHYVERGDVLLRTGDKYQTVDAVHDFDKAIEILQVTVDKTIADLAFYAKEAATWNEPEIQLGYEIGGGSAPETPSKTVGMGHTDKFRGQVAAAHEDGGPYLQSNSPGSAGDNASAGGDNISKITAENLDEGSVRDADDSVQESKIGGIENEGSVSNTSLGEDGAGEDRNLSSREAQDTSKGYNHDGPNERTKNPKKHPRPEQRTLDEQQQALADAYFRRSQCKLQLGTNTPALYDAALEDAINATHYQPDDDDYQLAVATCYIKLKRFEEAMESFKVVTKRSPNNEKALYQYAFCQRAVGRHRDAIEGLTQILAVANKAHKRAMKGEVDPDYHMTIPLERIYETRGTMFHEIAAHKLALADLGRAISLNPDRSENYYLRGDCHSKLGNYELALADYDMADQTGFSDMCSLTSNRGMVRRICGDSDGARIDFEVALELLHSLNEQGVDGGGVGLHDKYDKEDAALLGIRLSSLRALCFLDVGLYNAGHDILVNTAHLVSEIEEHLLAGKTITDCLLSIDERNRMQERISSRAKRLEEARAKDAAIQKNAGKTMRTRELALESEAELEKIEKNVAAEAAADENEMRSRAEKEEEESTNVFELVIDETSLQSIRRLKWVLLYHSALAMHMQQLYDQAHDYLAVCTDITMIACAPDDLVIGMCFFFMGVQLSQIDRLAEAEDALNQASSSNWGSIAKNSTLINFSKAKLFQQQGRHQDAIAAFDKSIQIDPNNAHAYFRRAWSHKALGGLQGVKNAGSDFETAKSLRWEDPNFAIDYKRIAKYEYMALESEPDVQFTFPSLLPRPGGSLSGQS